jgi:perosamine synthetase
MKRLDLKMSVNWADSSVLITGGTGSLGRRLARIILDEYHPRRLIIFSRDEHKQSEMQADGFEGSSLRYFIGDVRDQDRLRRAMRGVDVVIHAAVLQQVQACEYNPIEAIMTNIIGARNVIDAALDTSVKKVIALSTDKAVGPVNLYGATKLCSEKLFVQSNAYSGGKGTQFSCVRYGNIVDNQDGVISLFLRQCETGKIAITDPRMTRFWMTQERSARFALDCLDQMRGGEVFVPKIPSMSLIDLARAIAPECELEYIGIRPGEKLHEALISEDEARHTLEFEDRYIIQPVHPWWDTSHWSHGAALGEHFRYTSDMNHRWLTISELRGLVSNTEAHEGDLRQAAPPSVRKTLLPYGRQWIDDDDVAAVTAVLRSDWLTTGPKVDEFEHAFAEFTGSKHAVAVTNGTAALHTAVYALDIQPGDEVIVTPMTFAASVNCVLYQGGTPVFVDVEPDTLLIDPEQIEAKITSRTKAIIAVDYAGHPCDYDRLQAIAQRHNLKLIDDACHAVGGSYNGRPVGTLADLNTFSLHPVKHFTTGEGGVITTDDAELARRMRIFRNHGITTDHRQRAEVGGFFYEMVDLGYNYRITDFQCALGLSQLRRLPEFLARRQHIAALYDAAFVDIDYVKSLAVRPNVNHAYHLYMVQFDTEALGLSRAEIFSALRAANIGVNVHYIPVHLHPYYQQHRNTGPGMCPIAEAAYERLITLPIFPQMVESDVDDVILAVRNLPQLSRVNTHG